MIKYDEIHIKNQILKFSFLFQFSEFTKTLGVPGKPTSVLPRNNHRLSIKSRISSEILALRNLKVSINFDENQNSDISNFKSELSSELPGCALVRPHCSPAAFSSLRVPFSCPACVERCSRNHSIASSFADKPVYLSSKIVP